MGAYYRLVDRLCLRGWEKLPYAIVDARAGDVDFLPKSVMETLLMCDGSRDFESPLVADRDRGNAAELLARGRIEPCAPGSGLAPEQRYRLYPNRYVPMAHWSLTGRCNYRCKHCFMSAPGARYGELSHAACMEVARQIASCGIPKVALSGGEPLVRPDFMEIAAELSRLGVVIVQLHTNGALLDAGVLDGLEGLGQRPDIVMSFDGVGFHDWMRGVPGAEKAVDAAFGLCAERGFRTVASMCVCRANLGTLRETVNHLASVGCSGMRAGRVNNMGEWVGNGADLTPTYEEYLRAVLDYIPLYYEDGMPIPLALSGAFSASPSDPARYTLVPMRTGLEDGTKPLFSCARSLLQVYPDGRPAVCDVLGPDFVGMPPVASDEPGRQTVGLADVLSTGSAYMELMETRCASFHDRNPECRDCPYLAVCGGGCRAAAYQACGTIFAKDPMSCAFFRGGWAQKIVEVLRDVRPESAPSSRVDLLFSAGKP